MNADVIVVGGGLAGLNAARDLVAGGADVVLLEARGRPGGRVEQTRMADGRIVQLGGEVVGSFHEAYIGLVAELGLTLVPAFPDLPGEETWVMADGHHIGDDPPWFDDADRAAYERAETAFAALARTVDPDDPWLHPDAGALDDVSVGDWLRSVGATPNVVRARELAMLSLSAESVERTSLLADLRKEAAAGAHGFYDYEVWEHLRVAEGSATVALTLAEQLGERIRYASPVVRLSVGGPSGRGGTRGTGGRGGAGGTGGTRGSGGSGGPGGPGGSRRSSAITANGERFDADAIVCAVPVGPLRNIRIDGVSAERLRSLDRQRHALAAKAVFVYKDSFWEANGQNGAAYFETAIMGGTWVQREGVISALVPPERLAPLLATSPAQVEGELVQEMVASFGERAHDTQAVFLRRWGVDPYTLGYITAWRPGDVMAVGPLHATHEPPFYVCGSDQWVCGYMEGAVRTGRAAAAAALHAGG